MVGYPREGETFGEYLVDGVLGRGGMGVVYSATHVRIKRRVALKVITPQLAGTDEYRERFLNEAETLVRLDSPHIIQVLDHGEVDGSLFIATQLVHGADLAQRIESGPLSVGTALALAIQVTSGVADAHRGGVLHRDIKPSNVLVTGPDDAPFAYLCDFGIAQDTEPDRGLTMTGAVIGTFPYLAPERFDGAPAAVTTDVYALGCLLWAMLTGSPPYDGTQFTIARDHVEAPVRQLLPGQPWVQDLNGVLAQSMAKDPAHRFAGVHAMRVALDHVLAGIPIDRRRDHVQPAAAKPAAVLSPPARPMAPADVTEAAPFPASRAFAPPPPPPPAPGPAVPLPGSRPARRGRRAGWVAVAAALTALVAVGVTAVVLRSGSDDPTARDDTSATESVGTRDTETGEVGGVATTADPTTAGRTTATPPTGSPDPTPIAVRVVGTCGDGSCYLQVRTGTSAGADELVRDGHSVRWANDSAHEVLCQARGATVSSTSLNASSDVWARTSDGGWVSALHLDGIDSFNVEVPC
ncbi:MULTISPECIES: serine/threonine-protein kinase [unclassified Nocardioides]|uniref:serine/threonine-protein kinase n=1 Tax=unclassified Nocardioides TaxID=2615069 RepID=UPI0006F3E064|nr:MULTISPECIES: serine/threonine-protein kinase [unclassified Nocardioides]KRA39068.1 hypothetical protein ASD81_10985 [Nocardioides sp. Root614]KRA93027.1 hypothetical protein ASD84_11250 [Nocardioides sp. Root682]